MDTPDSVCRPRICRARPLLGTFVEIRSAGASRSAAEQAVEAAFAAIAKVQRLMSFHDAGSDVSRLNREAFNHGVVIDPWTYEVLETSLALHRQSMGAFDIAVAPALQELGMLPPNEGERDVGRIERATSGAIELLPDHRVRFHHPATRIDLGGIAKGFAVDRAIDALREQRQSHGLVNAGGDLATFGSFPETVALRDPRNPCNPIGNIAIANEALASSGRLFNPFETADALGSAAIDPATQKPTTEIAGASVRASSCAIADALTKVVMITGERAAELLSQYRADALMVMASGDVRVTPEWANGIRACA
jgi:thiamine biosynthesis lipoprotein